MKKTTQIHIGGRHLFIDDDAYQKLGHYLESLKTHFSSDGETGVEIVEDIEQRIAELLENKITGGKQAVTIDDVDEAIGILGKVEDFVYDDAAGESRQEYDYSHRRNYRRLYRDPDNYYVGGVASGIGEYFDIDPLWIRLAFVALVVLKGAGVLIYLILWIVVPKARTTTEKLQMRGKPVNLSTIKDSVNEEYEKVKTTDNMGRTSSAVQTRNALDSMMRAVGLVFMAFFKFIIAMIGIVFLIIGSVFLAVLIMFVLGFTNIFGHIHILNGMDLPNLGDFFATSGHYYIAIIALIIFILIPIVVLIYGGIKILFNIKTKHPILRAFILTAWILALILFVTIVIINVPNSSIESTGSQSSVIKSGKYARMVIDVRDNTENKHIVGYRVMGYHFKYSKWDEALYDNVQLTIGPSENDSVYLTIKKLVKNVDPYQADDYLNRIDYKWAHADSVLTLDKYFETDDEDFWLFARVDLNLRIPRGQQIRLTEEACDLLGPEQQKLYCGDTAPVGKRWLMSPEGSLIQAK
jgi:phage shock protein PspC (stress-responsive transcriptional regulator)